MPGSDVHLAEYDSGLRMTRPAKRKRQSGMVSLMDRQTVTVEEAAKALGCSRTAAYDLIRRGEFPVVTIKLGRRIVVPAKPLQRLLDGDAAA